jgi:hypothetical protein
MPPTAVLEHVVSLQHQVLKCPATQKRGIAPQLAGRFEQAVTLLGHSRERFSRECTAVFRRLLFLA